MDRRDEDEPSFDPRTWRAPAADVPAPTPSVPPARPPADESFDPRSWSKDGGASKPAASAPPGQARITPNARRYLIAAGVGAVLLIAGGEFAYHQRPRGSASTSPSASVGASTAVPVQPDMPGSSHRVLTLTGPEQLPMALSSLGVAPEVAKQVADKVILAIGSAPGEIRLTYTLVGNGAQPTLAALEATRADGAGIALTASDDGFAAQKLDAHLSIQIRAVSGEMDATNFYSSAVTAGIDDSLISDFAKALAFDFNFATEIKAGDVFGAAIEQAANAAGQPVGLPRLVYVSMRTETKQKALYSFTPPGEKEPAWFDANGRSASRALMRTPVDGARISSTFGPRFHPVLHFIKMHKGIDFAAPIGTPIYASGGGVVEWAAMKGANGNLTILKHDNGWETYYLHQSMFMPGVSAGARVTQGQKIGAIGTTGRSTGPHLHYEVHIGGEAVDPQSIDTGSGTTLSGGAMAKFAAERARIDEARAGAR